MTRTPPHDLEVEKNLLGAMMLGTTPIVAALPLVGTSDFYSPNHATVFDAIVALHSRGETAESGTVAAYLRTTGEFEKVGGYNALLDLGHNVPSTGAAATYARIIANLAAARKLIGVAGELAELGYQGGDVADAIDVGVTMLGEVQTPSVDLPDGLTSLDTFLDRPPTARAPWVIPGLLRADWRVIVVASEGIGKALALDTPIRTTTGWSTMGDLRAGDWVFRPNGMATMVTVAHDVRHDRPCYRVTFSDGASIVADGEHLWRTVDYRGRQGGRWDHAVITTEQMRDTLHARGGHTLNHAIEVTAPIRGFRISFPVDPYVLGAWLGDGTSSCAEITCADHEILFEIAAAGEHVRQLDGHTYRWALNSGDKSDPKAETLRGRLRALGVLNNKHIPECYLRADIGSRLALLQGLMDTDGSVGANGAGKGRGAGAAICEITLTNERLAGDVLELIQSLGIKVTSRVSAAKIDGRITSARWRMSFQTDQSVFRMKRKAGRLTPLRTRRAKVRYVKSVESIESVPVRCITVDAEDGMFLAGRELIPTHNSMMFRAMAMMPAQGIHPFALTPIPRITSLIIDLENPDDGIEHGCKPIRARAMQGEYERDRTYLWSHRQGLNIRSRADRALFDRVLAHVRPDLVVMGPLNKVFQRGKDDMEEAAADTQRVLDDLRTRHRFALMIEHHAPKAQSGVRDMIPFGSQRWQSWPEMGIGLVPEGEYGDVRLTRFRGDRLPSQWPDLLQRGGRGQFPWLGVWHSGVPDSDEGAA